jgi:hypothetical protein
MGIGRLRYEGGPVNACVIVQVVVMDYIDRRDCA